MTDNGDARNAGDSHENIKNSFLQFARIFTLDAPIGNWPSRDASSNFCTPLITCMQIDKKKATATMRKIANASSILTP